MTEDMFETDWSFLSGVSVETTAPPVKHTEKKPARVYQMHGFEYSLSRPHSAESRAKISAGNLGKTRTAEQRAKLSAANLGKTLTAEHKAKVSQAMKGRVPVGQAAAAEARRGKPGKKWSAETRAVHEKYVTSAETKAKISQSMKGRVPVGQAASAKARSHPVMTPYGEFSSVSVASREISEDVGYRIKKGIVGYYKITKEAK